MPPPLANGGMYQIMPNVRIGADPVRSLHVPKKFGVPELVSIQENKLYQLYQYQWYQLKKIKKRYVEKTTISH